MPGHWVLVLIDVKNEKIIVYDSETSTDLTLVQVASSNLIHFLFGKRDWLFEVNRDHLQDTPKHCGVFNMLIARKIVCRPNAVIPTNEREILNARYRLAVEILEDDIF